MSERSNVSIAEILGDNYYIDKLTSSDYSPAVGDTVTITLLVKDVFGDPVTGQTRTVTCTEGSFVSVNGTSITATDSAEVTTGSGGTVTLGLSVSVADNIIVSDGRAECVVSSLSTSITNLVQIQSVGFDFGSLTVNSSSTKTKTVKAKPDGMDSAVIPRIQNFCTVQGANLNGTSFSLTAQNQSNGTHTCNATVLLVYFPHSWSI